MKSNGILLAMILLLAIPAMAQSPPAGMISGNYVEFRNADVYTGPCFANSEVGLTGEEAVLAWHVANGSWNGVPVAGLNVVAVVRASATLGDPFANPLPAITVFIVDAHASDTQRAALVNFAQTQAAGLLNEVVAIETAPIAFTTGVGAQHATTTLAAGNLVRLETRGIRSADQICHNEEVFYPPLATHLVHAMPAVAVASSYRGNHLGITWNDAGRRSSFVGTFSD